MNPALVQLMPRYGEIPAKTSAATSKKFDAGFLDNPPVKLHSLLVEYFERLQKKKVIARQDERLTAMSFLSMCYGFQMSELIHRQIVSVISFVSTIY